MSRWRGTLPHPAAARRDQEQILERCAALHAIADEMRDTTHTFRLAVLATQLRAIAETLRVLARGTA